MKSKAKPISDVLNVAEKIASRRELYPTTVVDPMTTQRVRVEQIIDLKKEVKKFPFIELVYFGDFHSGNPMTWYQGAWAACKYMYQRPNCYGILTGDLTEVGSSDGHRLLHEMLFNNDQQLDYVLMMLRPLAKKGKILVSANGNHNVNSKLRKEGFDIDTAMINSLNEVSARTINPPSFIQAVKIVVSDKVEYTLLVAHGFGGGRKNASKLTKVEELANIIVGYDIYVSGHGHSFVHSELNHCAYTGEDIRRSVGTCIMTPGYVQAGDNYIDKMLINPSILGSSGSILDVKTKRIDITPRINVSEFLPTEKEFNGNKYQEYLER